jgi:hypothetical protein
MVETSHSEEQSKYLNLKNKLENNYPKANVSNNFTYVYFKKNLQYNSSLKNILLLPQFDKETRLSNSGRVAQMLLNDLVKAGISPSVAISPCLTILGIEARSFNIHPRHLLDKKSCENLILDLQHWLKTSNVSANGIPTSFIGMSSKLTGWQPETTRDP